jgi:hypothetical protein
MDVFYVQTMWYLGFRVLTSDAAYIYWEHPSGARARVCRCMCPKEPELI